MNDSGLLLVIVVATAVAFDFTNGFHDVTLVSGGILGVGIGKRLAEVRWGLAGRMVTAWVLTLPAAALVAAGVWKAADGLGSGTTGYVVMALLAAAAACALFAATQRQGAVRAGDV